MSRFLSLASGRSIVTILSSLSLCLMIVMTATIPDVEAAAPLTEPAGAPNPAVEAAVIDCKGLSKYDRPYARYFWVVSEKGEDRDNFLVVFCAQLNKLSRAGKLAWPTFVTPDLLRIDVRDYRWDKNGILSVWEKTVRSDVVFHQQAIVEGEKVLIDVYHPGGKDFRGKEYDQGIYEQSFSRGDVVPQPSFWLKRESINLLRYMTYSESPILVAEWFFGQTARQTDIYQNDEPGTGYYDFLGIKDRDEFFKLTGANANQARERFALWKAAVTKSKVSKQSRLAFREGAFDGFIWGTLDTFAVKDRGIILRNLKDGEYAHNAEEYFGRLPNGLPVVALFDKEGKRQAKAPPQIGADKSPLSLKSGSNDLNIHNPLSCIRCHGKDDMLRDIGDMVRKLYKRDGPLALGTLEFKTKEELENDYLRDMDRLLKKDRLEYSEAIKEVTTSKLNPKGWTCEKFAEEYSKAWNHYAEEDVTLKTAARELGTTPEKLLDGIKAFTKERGLGDNVLAVWLVDKDETLDRMTWEQSYALAMAVSLGLKAPEKRVPLKTDKGEDKK